MPECEELRRYLLHRRRLGLSVEPEAPLAVMPNGRPITPAELGGYLRRARSARVAMDFNASLCQGLFEARYGGLADGHG